MIRRAPTAAAAGHSHPTPISVNGRTPIPPATAHAGMVLRNPRWLTRWPIANRDSLSVEERVS
jgi:hypothetical protein